MAPMAPSNVATIVNDFLALPLQMPASVSSSKESTHFLYLRANTPKVPSENTPREVFAVNVPADTTEKHLRSLFANQLGGARIESVAFEGARVGKGISAPVAPVQPSKKRKRDDGEEATVEEVGILPEVWDRDIHRSGSTAVLTFVDRASAALALKEVKRAIKHKATIKWVADKGTAAPLGSARYLNHHAMRYPDHAVLQASVDAFMTAFTAKEEARQSALAKLRAEPDEDGFITVTRGGRTGAGREEDAKAKDEELKKREKSRTKEDFYRFQVREKKKEQAQDLVKGYQEDQRRVEEMKRRKGKFRPE